MALTFQHASLSSASHSASSTDRPRPSAAVDRRDRLALPQYYELRRVGAGPHWLLVKQSGCQAIRYSTPLIGFHSPKTALDGQLPSISASTFDLFPRSHVMQPLHEKRPLMYVTVKSLTRLEQLIPELEGINDSGSSSTQELLRFQRQNTVDFIVARDSGKGSSR